MKLTSITFSLCLLLAAHASGQWRTSNQEAALNANRQYWSGPDPWHTSNQRAALNALQQRYSSPNPWQTSSQQAAQNALQRHYGGNYTPSPQPTPQPIAQPTRPSTPVVPSAPERFVVSKVLDSEGRVSHYEDQKGQVYRFSGYYKKDGQDFARYSAGSDEFSKPVVWNGKEYRFLQ